MRLALQDQLGAQAQQILELTRRNERLEKENARLKKEKKKMEEEGREELFGEEEEEKVDGWKQLETVDFLLKLAGESDSEEWY
ncbi:hypothetical protein BDB01DRAFT_909131 [Pilobolus umbonatus]|nr:hypothetical protein BDB01DRAFT_909131 [Pilobolus umbonatus]